MEKKFRLTISVPQALYEKMLEILPAMAPYGWEERDLPDNASQFILYGDTRESLTDIEHCASSADPEVFTKLELVEIPDPINAWKEYFTPVKCGSRFVVLPPWLKHQCWGARQKILIEPRSAFGTGHHATTALVLTALGDLLNEEKLSSGATFLDLGCGSGILGIAAALSGLNGVALDIDPIALENTMENVALNAVGGISPALGSVDSIGNNRYDLIMANILAQPLIDMAPAVASAVRPGGWLILSGILRAQAPAVADAYEACGMRKRRQLEEGDWVALVCQLPGNAQTNF